MIRGQYDYKKADTDIKTRYYIEFTRDQKVFDMMESSKFTFDMLNKLEYDYLQDAITDYINLYYQESVLHVMLFEQIILNGEVILEQCKDMQNPNILPQEIKRQVDSVTQTNEALTAELSYYQNFIKECNGESLFQKFKRGEKIR